MDIMSWTNELLEISEIIGILLILLTATVTLFWIYADRCHYWVGKTIPSTSPVSLLSSSASVVTGKHMHEIERALYLKYGKVFGAYMGKIPLLYVADTDLIKQILIKDFNSFSSRRDTTTGKPLVSAMITHLKGNEQWKNLRHTMTPAFSTGKLKKMLPIISECAKLTVDNFNKYSRNGTPVDCKRLYGSYSLDVIANVAFGTKLDSHNDPDNIFVHHAKNVFSIDFNWKMLFRVLFPKIGAFLGFGSNFFPQETLDFFQEIVLSIIDRREKTNEVRNDVLQLLIESMKEQESISNGTTEKEIKTESEPQSPVIGTESFKRKALTKNEVLAQTILFFVAGYDTTSTALTVTTYYLATNPECQKIAIKEVDTIWKNRDIIDSDCLAEAKYLGACIDEALRLSPPIVRVDRTCVKDYKLGETGVTVPAGMIIQIPTYAIHHDPQYYEEPETFNPNRFLDENRRKINPYAYMPFGGGPRSCIAMRLALLEVKLCLVYLLKEYFFSPSDKTKIPLEYHKSILLQPKDVILHINKRTRT